MFVAVFVMLSVLCCFLSCALVGDMRCVSSFFCERGMRPLRRGGLIAKPIVAEAATSSKKVSRKGMLREAIVSEDARIR
jgi:hypothetical protein